MKYKLNEKPKKKRYNRIVKTLLTVIFEKPTAFYPSKDNNKHISSSL